ncbi:MAG TPA: MFS transporter [Pyrinomonadaceae bacterium]|nr:MFS transporter [Pyrinomonadaceae bacterium]
MSSAVKQPCDEAAVRAAPDKGPCAQRAGRWVLAAAITGSGITFIDGTVVNVALPVLQEKLDATVAEVQWVVESYMLLLAALILVGGSLGDRYGRRRVFSLGVAVFAAASLWCGLAPNVHQLIVARAAQGLGAALLVPGSLALISATFSREQRGRAIGTWSGFTSIAAGVGPVLGGWLVESVSWRWIFFINLPLAAAVLVISYWRVPESRDEQAAGSLDWAGALLATVGLGGVVYGLIESGTRGFADPVVVASFIVGAAALAGFVLVEARGREPMMPLALFRSRNFAGANLLTLFLYAALGGALFFLPFNLIQVQGYTATEAGAALTPFVLTMFVLSRWTGGLVDRYGAKLPLVVGPSIAAAGFVLLARPGVGGSYWASFFPAVMVMSLGMAASVAPLTTVVMTSVAERHAGLASGVNNAVSRLASLLAVAALGVVVLSAFNTQLDRRLDALPLAPEARQKLDEQRTKLAAAEVPAGADAQTKAALERALGESFVAGFRFVMFIAAGLALLSALSAWLLIEGKAARTEKGARPV